MRLWKRVRSLASRATWRLYQDFLMGSRLSQYRDLLTTLVNSGYDFLTFSEYWERLTNGQPVQRKVVLLRHDIDTDVETARAMWEIEKSLGIRSSYYFRERTIDWKLIEDIGLHGAEASYHYEELSTFARRRRIKSRSRLMHHLSEIRRDFERNLLAMRQRTGLPMKTVASHGDFVNRRLSVRNTEVLADSTLRARLGISLELYDESLMATIGSRHADLGEWNRFWVPEPPEAAAASGGTIIYLLVHPKNWRSRGWVNLHEAIVRLAQGLVYSVLPEAESVTPDD